jgi:hypothetical protein
METEDLQLFLGLCAVSHCPNSNDDSLIILNIQEPLYSTEFPIKYFWVIYLNKFEMYRIFKESYALFIELDMFGHQPNLNFIRKNTHKTLIGAICSARIRVFMVYYLYRYLYRLFNRGFDSVSSIQTGQDVDLLEPISMGNT